MGAIFAPWYANLTMGYWEEGHIWPNNPFAKHIVFYGRNIDYILLIWDGGLNVFSSFVTYCNANPLGLSFNHVIDPVEIVFLDFHMKEIPLSVKTIANPPVVILISINLAATIQLGFGTFQVDNSIGYTGIVPKWRSMLHREP